MKVDFKNNDRSFEGVRFFDLPMLHDFWKLVQFVGDEEDYLQMKQETYENYMKNTFV